MCTAACWRWHSAAPSMTQKRVLPGNLFWKLASTPKQERLRSLGCRIVCVFLGHQHKWKGKESQKAHVEAQQLLMKPLQVCNQASNRSISRSCAYFSLVKYHQCVHAGSSTPCTAVGCSVREHLISHASQYAKKSRVSLPQRFNFHRLWLHALRI